QGSYQKKNIKTVLQTLEIVKDLGFDITLDDVRIGLRNVVANTGLKGRWQILQERPKIICDTAHNADGFRYVVSQLKAETHDKLHMVFGVVNDKDLDPLLAILPKKAHYYFCRPNIPRGLDAGELRQKFLQNGFSGTAYSSVREALDSAKNKAADGDLIYVGGSTFVV